VRFEFKNFAFLSEESVLAAEASLCASDQGQFWPYHDMIFANRDMLFDDQEVDSRRVLKQIAWMLDLDTRAFDQCLDSREYRQDVQQILNDGRAQGVDSTPSVYVNGLKVNLPHVWDELGPVIEQELAKAGQ
jgi:protein-disulfide isomerase